MSGGHQAMLAIGGSGGGGGGGSVYINNLSIEKTDPAGATATYKLNSDGTVKDHDNVLLETWLVSGSAGDYEVQVTGTGTITGSATGSWLPLSTNRTWSVVATAGQYKTATLSVKIRRASDGVELDTATIDLIADATA